MMSFLDLSRDFQQYHKNALNMALHLVTTPAGYIAVLALIQSYASLHAQQTATALYAVCLLASLPIKLWSVTACFLFVLSWVTSQLDISNVLAIGLVAFSYFGQDFSHWLTGEKTYQSTYTKDGGWPALLAQHTFFLLPCVLDAIPHMDNGFLYWIVASNHVVYNKISAPEDRKHLTLLRQWVLSKNPSKEHTTHWWFQTLEKSAKDSFDYIANSKPCIDMFRQKYSSNLWNVEVIEGMNEIYVASESHQNNSDTVFYMQHIDGPWYLFPFCGAYRCILAVNENNRICTHFPMVNTSHTLSDGDVVGFDFNREIHYIDNNVGAINKEQRITLKLHYVIYPKCLKPIGKLLAFVTTMYDISARNLFVATIRPPSLFWQGMAYVILISTKLTFLGEQFIGYNNVVYLIVATLVNQFVHQHAFLVATSYMHYLMYIATYAQKTNVSHGLFKRNVIFFKTLALIQLAYYYISNFEYDPVSVVMIAFGYGISTSAAFALGIDRTYFGVELGLYKPKWVSSFPYNVIPHPMIVGACLGLGGLYKMAGMRDAMPYLVPGHVIMYLAHLSQEMYFDVYRAPPATPVETNKVK
eukprot:CAMPEP_0196582902 /NCGR_PEP_ID=MMETSP1081-20130531/41225_1 /TAXON_ID=36882 /ORGANISM="Pyramimonas amylifera, Strain CCMP720" /LENGTH=583 /DNA_ID=CAMNT_0041903623 /DNA_START=227 /DNA_END=1978 /DNA_ORIENTATION=-